MTQDMERFSSFERVAGKVPEEYEELLLQRKSERFNDQIFDELRGKEREKTLEEIEIIALANRFTNEVLREYGKEDFDVPAKNIHVISEDQWPEGHKGDAFYVSMMQAVAVREQEAKIVFMKKVFHEMLHFKSYNAMQLTIGNDPELREYRVGFTVHTRDGKEKFFTNLNEAITEEMTKKFILDVLEHPLFASEAKDTRSAMRDYPHEKTVDGKPMLGRDTYYYSATETRQPIGGMIGRLVGRTEKTVRTSAHEFTYLRERAILEELERKIVERNPGMFGDENEVFGEFSRAMMTGNILPLGRLIDGVFGHGTFRRIGELDENIDEQERFVKSL